MEYLPRIADSLLVKRLAYKGAVLIEGPKWCGKTSTARRQSKSELDLADTEILEESLALIQINGKALLEGASPRLIDEWQELPRLWDLVRNEVDKRNLFGQFILTGSALPPDREAIHHTGTGRISRLTMRTMSLWESKESSGEISLKELFDGKTGMTGRSDCTLEDIGYYIVRGGWPMSIGIPKEGALLQATDYYDAVVNYDITRIKGQRKSPIFANNLLRAYSRHIGYQTPLTTLQSDLTAGGKTPDVETIDSYISSFKDIFVIEEMKAWNTNLRSKTAIRTSNTRYFTDPSIGCAALGAGPADLIRDLKALGMMFENLCVRDLRIYAQGLDGEVYHYRDSSGLECDAVIHLRNGKYGLVEIKLGGDSQIKAGCETLNKLEKKIDTEKMGSPVFKMVLTAVGKYAYLNEEGIWIVPITTLKD